MRTFSIALLFVASALLNCSAATVSQDEELLQMAAQYSDADLFDILTKYGVDPAFPPLNKAMEAGDYNAVIILLEYGVNLNTRGPDTSERWWAHGETNMSAIRRLDNKRQTALEFAIERGEKELVKMLLAKGADPYVPRVIYYTFGAVGPADGKRPRDKQGREIIYTNQTTTAMYDAIVTGRLDILEKFVECRVDLNKPCLNGKTKPLEVALSNKEVAIYLIAHGAKY